MTHFKDLGLAEPILRAVSAEGYETPTPIQAAAIPAVLSGRDLLGTAQTGTGKTAAFVLPILHALQARSGKPGPKRCSALILAPTRELAAQIAESLRVYGRNIRPSFAVVIGGAKPGPQIRALASGVDVVIATPGRLLDHMGTGAVRLDAVRTVVLDEADQMMDLGFMPAIRRIMASLPASRQTLLFSATMPAPIRKLANDFLRDPAEVAVAPAARPIEKIGQFVKHVDAGAKRRVLIDVLTGKDVERAIVFTRTKRGADKVAEHLDKAGLASAAIHGNKSQGQRTRALDAFRKGNVNILVATDIAARGIDVDDVSHVVNFEMPNTPEAYVHRIGRTARAGKAGVAVSLCDGSERGLLRDIERLIGARITAEGEPLAEPPKERKKGRGGRPAPKPAPAASANGKKRPKRRRQNRKTGAPKAAAAPRGRPSGGDDAGLARMLGNLGG